jgi:Ser-tRNA(Ala) deacylase AlaX
MKIAWLSFELCAGMEMAAASIDEACSIKVARRRILDRIRSALNILEKLQEEATDLWRRKNQRFEEKQRIFGGNVEDRTECKR